MQQLEDEKKQPVSLPPIEYIKGMVVVPGDPGVRLLQRIDVKVSAYPQVRLLQRIDVKVSTDPGVRLLQRINVKVKIQRDFHYKLADLVVYR